MFTNIAAESVLVPAIEALVHELRQFREDFAPKTVQLGQGPAAYSWFLGQTDHPSSPSPTLHNRRLLVQVQQQTFQLAALERELLTARQDAQALRIAHDKVMAEKAQLQVQVAHHSTAKADITTLDVLQKEFAKLKRYLDFYLENSLGPISTTSSGDVSSSEAAPAPDCPAATLRPSSEVQVKAELHHQASPPAYNTEFTSSSPHRLDHPQDCECSFACRQWGEQSVADGDGADLDTGSWDFYPRATRMSPVCAAILKGDHDCVNCNCAVCAQWSDASPHGRCRSPSGSCSCYDCTLANVLADRAEQRDGRPAHSTKSSIHSIHSTCFEPSTSPLQNAAASPSSNQAFERDPCLLMLNYMLNPHISSCGGRASVKPVATRAHVNSSAEASGWTLPRAPSVCPPPIPASWPMCPA